MYNLEQKQHDTLEDNSSSYALCHTARFCLRDVSSYRVRVATACYFHPIVNAKKNLPVKRYAVFFEARSSRILSTPLHSARGHCNKIIRKQTV